MGGTSGGAEEGSVFAVSVCPGNAGHGVAPNLGEPSSSPDAMSVIAQWCLPPRRQHAGNEDSGSAGKSG